MTRPVGVGVAAPPQVARGLILLGLGLAVVGWALYVIARGQLDGPLLQGITLYASLAASGWLILRLRPEHVLGWLLALFLPVAGIVAVALGLVVLYGAGGPVDRSLAVGAFLLLWLLFSNQLPFALFIVLFPDGRLPDPRWRPVAVIGVIGAAAASVTLMLAAPPGQAPVPLAFALPRDLAGPLHGALAATPLPAVADGVGVILLLGAVAALIARYRAGPTLLRQQIKWFVAGVIASVAVGLVATPLEPQPGLIGAAARAIDILALPLPLLGAAAGVLRYRLWEIDVVLTRAAAVGIVWLVLAGALIALTFAAGVTLAGTDIRVVLALVLALGVSVALRPLRRWVETWLARVLGTDRIGYFALRRLSAADGEALHTDLGTQIAETARTATGSSWAAAWLRVVAEGDPTLRLLGSAGLDTPPIVVRPEALADLSWLPRARLWADLPAGSSHGLEPLGALSPAAVVALRAGNTTIGLLAIGDRRAEPIEDSDLQVLDAMGREAGLLLHNRQLEAELEARLAELAGQAREIRDSRVRIVAAQDEERRRIERDLHDGVQQQLVNLATRLRRASLAPQRERTGLLADLAREAEAAVFALRELARGIYPTTLTDLGLPIALETRAARIPQDVRVLVAPALVNRRLEPHIETALYHVALEAMTNSQKHAPGSSITVSLGFDEHEQVVTLTVGDDGPGMSARPVDRPGAGLQNMRDRVAAVGGTLRIDGPPGEGTWVTAEVPISPDPDGQAVGPSAGLGSGSDAPVSRR